MFNLCVVKRKFRVFVHEGLKMLSEFQKITVM